MAQTASDKAFRKGISLMELMEMFPDEATATAWFEAQMWPDGRCCGHCGSTKTREVPSAKPMPYWCSSCRSYFSVRTGTVMQKSRIPLRKWVIAVYLDVTSLKSVSSMKLHRDIKVTQKTAWFMLHRIRGAWTDGYRSNGSFSGPLEADEAYFGGKRANMSNAKRKELADARFGRSAVGKVAVAGIKDRETKRVRERAIQHTDKPTLQGSVRRHTATDTTVYEGLPSSVRS